MPKVEFAVLKSEIFNLCDIRLHTFDNFFILFVKTSIDFDKLHDPKQRRGGGNFFSCRTLLWSFFGKNWVGYNAAVDGALVKIKYGH